MSFSAAATAEGEPASPPSPRSWLRPGVADVIFLLTALVVLRGTGRGLLDDPGLGWHLRNIDAMLAEGGWLRVDPFTESHGPEPAVWYTNQWLGELPLWLGWRFAGLEGIAVVTALVVALTARCLYKMLLHDGLPWPTAVFWTLLGMMGTSVSWNARPNLFTILFVLITARACDRFSRGELSRSRIWWLAALFLLWANIHGGFLAGLLILVSSTLCELACAVGSLSKEERDTARSRCLNLMLLTGGCALATLVNPYGAGLYRWVFQLLGDNYFMTLNQEWKPPPFREGGALRFEILMLLFPLVLGLTARRLGLVELGLAVLWLHFALTGFRYVALWVVVAVPLLARSSAEIPYLQQLAMRLQLSTAPGSLFATRADAGSWVWSLAFAIGLVAAAPLMQGRVAGHGDKIIATRAVDRFLEIGRAWKEKHGRRPVVFHSYDWGGYLIWHGWPEVRNWIDDRNEAQGRKHTEDYFSILSAEPGWEEKLARVDLICIESGAPVTKLLEKSPNWRELYRDDKAVIFERIKPG